MCVERDARCRRIHAPRVPRPERGEEDELERADGGDGNGAGSSVVVEQSERGDERERGADRNRARRDAQRSGAEVGVQGRGTREREGGECQRRGPGREPRLDFARVLQRILHTAAREHRECERRQQRGTAPRAERRRHRHDAVDERPGRRVRPEHHERARERDGAERNDGPLAAAGDECAAGEGQHGHAGEEADLHPLRPAGPRRVEDVATAPAVQERERVRQQVPQRGGAVEGLLLVEV